MLSREVARGLGVAAGVLTFSFGFALANSIDGGWLYLALVAAFVLSDHSFWPD